jgi:hypothetical protein
MNPGQQGQQPQSQFNQRSDDAATRLKAQLSQEQGITLPERKVEVGPDGQPPKPPPPEGSYARQAYDQARAEQQAQAVQHMQEIGQQPEAGTLEQAMDGSQAPPLTPPAQPPQGPETQELTPNAQARFAKLTQDLREKDRALQELQEKTRTSEQTLAQQQEAFEGLQKQYQDMLQANLDNLDPETRMQVLQDARMQEMLAGFESKLMAKISKPIAELQENRMHDELMSLAGKYPAFDVAVHGVSIESVMGKNPNLSVEQAFRVIAEPGELVTREAVAATAVPPVIAPRASVQDAQSRYLPEPQSNPEQEMQEEAAQIGQLMRSMDPNDHKTGARLIEKNLADRLGDTLPGAHRR